MKIHHGSPPWGRRVRTLGRRLFRRAENNDDERIEHQGEGWLLRGWMDLYSCANDVAVAPERSLAPGP